MMDEEMIAELDRGIDRKKGQIERAEERLEVKRRKNKRVRERKATLQKQIAKAEQLIEEHERAIAYQKKQIGIWKGKLVEVPEEEDYAHEIVKRDKYQSELVKMENIRTEVVATVRNIQERKQDDFMIPILRKQNTRMVKKFKTLKGNGI